MMCEYGVENCIHAGKPHDEDCCFNGWFEHEYVCQECGNTMMSRKHSLGKVPEFKPKNCLKCGTEKSMT